MKYIDDYITTLIVINDLKKKFEYEIEKNLNLIKVQSPLFVDKESGLQDNLTGREKSIDFNKGKTTFQIVHSLAKWKRDALGRYNFPVRMGLYTDMKAIRKGETVDDIHSLYVEQWDWEKVISKSDRNINYLKDTVNSIYTSILNTKEFISSKYGIECEEMAERVVFITSQDLEDMYPHLKPSEREYVITKKHGSVFIIGIGDNLKSGNPHDYRSPDYDDWDLNGDLLIYSSLLDKVIEVTSMGIRVDENSILSQLEKSNSLERIDLPYHQKIIKSELPYTIGGGIGQSRVLLLLLNKEHIAEVQASSWEQKTLRLLKNNKIL